MQTTSVNGNMIISNSFGNPTQDDERSGGGMWILITSSGAEIAQTYSHYQNTPYDTLSRPDGSQCVSNTEGQLSNFYICPLGFEDDFLSSSSAADNSSSSGAGQSSSGAGDSSSSGIGEGASSSGGYDLCIEFPSLPGCGESGSSSPSNGNDGNQSSGSGGGGTCTDLSNCDWAKVDVQLTQLGVEVETRNAVRDIAGLLNSGYNISQQQLQTLQNLRNDISGLCNDLVGSVGSGADEIVNAIKSLENSLGLGNGGDGGGGLSGEDILGSGGTAGFLDSIQQAAGNIAGDSITAEWDYYSNLAAIGMAGDSLSVYSGFSGSAGSDSLISKGNLLASSLNEAFRPLIDYMSAEGRCVVDMSFSTGVMGIGCDGGICRIDFTNIFGVNAKAFFDALVVLLAVFGGAKMVLNALAGFRLVED